jgi:hypothetical protein
MGRLKAIAGALVSYLALLAVVGYLAFFVVFGAVTTAHKPGSTIDDVIGWVLGIFVFFGLIIALMRIK